MLDKARQGHPWPTTLSGCGVWELRLELMPPLLRICAIVADCVAVADEDPALAMLAGLPLTFLLHLVVELNVLLIVDFVVAEVVVVVGCHIYLFLITKLLTEFLVRDRYES